MGYIGKPDSLGNWLLVDKFDGLKIKEVLEIIDLQLIIFKYICSWWISGKGPNQVATYGPFTLSSNEDGMVYL